MHQQIRPSQFITTYGPGSILETPSGPVVIWLPDRVFNDHGFAIQDFEIRDARLSRDPRINGAGIVRIPTNAEVRVPQQSPLYHTEPLPYWSLCHEHGVLYSARSGCPQCRGLTPRETREKAGREAIRFVRACASGHLDDVDWNYVVHNGPICTGQPGHYHWVGGGGSLRNVEIRCPRCGAHVNFGQAYGRDWRCSGRYPEQGPRPAQSSCTTPARIIHRGAANLRIPDVISALTIPPLYSRLHSILQDSRIMAVCSTLSRMNLLTEANFHQGVVAITPPLGSSIRQFLRQRPWNEIQVAIGEVLAQAAPAAARTLKDEEFESLCFAARNGAPPVPSPQLGVPPLFEVRHSDVRHFTGPGGRLNLRVVPVSRLRMVVAQLGYKRLDVASPQTVSVGFQSGGRTWYPGVELFGEGVFIDTDDADLALDGERARLWEDSYQRSNPRDETLHPAYVWWHTLSHRLIRALSVDSGYSSASISERVYVRLEAGRPPSGGVLLYTVQPGGDGTLGGLIGLVPSFGQVIAAALRDIDKCSNDPLCEEAQPDGVNGSACYSCLLASETSCEQRNLHLDRLLLMQNMP